MSRRKPKKSQWREPIVLVPIIVAVITAIVGPIAYYYLTHQEQTKDIDNVDQSSVPTSTPQYSTPVPTSISQSSTRSSLGNITLDTDKNVYGFGDFVRVTGTVDTPLEGKTVRLDVYDPEGEVFQPYNESFGIADMDGDMLLIHV